MATLATDPFLTGINLALDCGRDTYTYTQPDNGASLVTRNGFAVGDAVVQGTSGLTEAKQLRRIDRSTSRCNAETIALRIIMHHRRTLGLS